MVTVEMHQQPGDRVCRNEAIGGNHFGPVTVCMHPAGVECRPDVDVWSSRYIWPPSVMRRLLSALAPAGSKSLSWDWYPTTRTTLDLVSLCCKFLVSHVLSPFCCRGSQRRSYRQLWRGKSLTYTRRTTVGIIHSKYLLDWLLETILSALKSSVSLWLLEATSDTNTDFE